MRITIANRLKPFSHQPGTFFVLPGTTFRLQIFPALIRIFDQSLLEEVPLNVKGPVKDFTVQQDLEKGCIRVWGNTQTGFFRYLLSPGKSKRIHVSVEKTPTNGLEMEKFSKEKEILPAVTERLSLGIHKAQDWTLMHRRCDMAEIFPIWMRLGQGIPQIEMKIDPQSLLEECQNVIEKGNQTEILTAFQNLYLTGFDLGLSPRLHDEDHQGFFLPILSKDENNPLLLLTQGASLIRSLFIQCIENRIDILPALPTAFHSGRLLHISCGTTGICDIEWSKHFLRRMIFRAAENRSFEFCFQRSLKQCRMRLSETDHGTQIPNGTVLNVIQGQEYFFDHFT